MSIVCCLQAASTGHDGAGSHRASDCCVIYEGLRSALHRRLDSNERYSAAQQQHMLCLKHLRNRVILRRKIGKLEQCFAAGVVMFGAALSVTGTYQAILNILTH